MRSRRAAEPGRGRTSRSSPSTWAEVTRSWRITSTPGSACDSRRSSGPSTSMADTAVKPRRSVPTAPWSTRRARSPAVSTSARSLRASARKRPASVVYAPVVPVQQRHADGAFRLLDLAAEWRLRHVVDGPRLGRARLLGDGNEGTDLVEGEHDVRKVSPMRNWACRQVTAQPTPRNRRCGAVTSLGGSPWALTLRRNSMAGSQ